MHNQNNFFTRFGILSLCLLLGLLTQAQEINKDSIRDVFREIKTVENAFNSKVLKLCGRVDKQNNALELYGYMDSIAPSPKHKLLFYNKYISYLMRANQVPKGLQLSDACIQLSRKLGLDRFDFEYTQIKCYGYIASSKLDSAMHYVNEAEKIVSKNKALLGNNLFRVYMHKADIEKLLGNHEEADVNFENAAKTLEPYPNNKNNAYVFAAVAYHFKTQKDYLKHAYYSQKLKVYYMKNGGYNDPEGHASMSNFLEFEDSEEQLEALKKALNINPDLEATLEQNLHLSELAHGLIKVNKPKEAIKYLEAYKENNHSIPILYKLRNYHLLEKAYELVNDCDNTLKTSRVKAQLIDSLRTMDMISKIADSKVKYETEKKEAQLELLKLEKEKEKQKKNFIGIIALLGLGAVILTGYFLYKNAKKNKLLNKQNILLERTIDEKNVLLKEVHHRVKNSFQIVSSLLYLQSENVTDETAKLAIKEAENRVRSMVLVHQKLYNKDELVGINSKEYIIDLVKDIFQSHSVKKEPINYNLNIESLILDIETITPLGLILNELIINTMKHAFKGIEEDNTINVDFAKVDDKLVLTVEDNGKGFEGDIKQTSFGITLMKALSKQLKATLNYKSVPKQGTQAVLNISKYTILS